MSFSRGRSKSPFSHRTNKPSSSSATSSFMSNCIMPRSSYGGGGQPELGFVAAEKEMVVEPLDGIRSNGGDSISVTIRFRPLREMWETSMKGLLSLVGRSTPSPFAYICEKNGNSLLDKMDELACFAPGMIALGDSGYGPEEIKNFLSFNSFASSVLLMTTDLVTSRSCR